ncbi:cysteine desulfurase family protein [Methylobacterium sp. A49B]
MRNDVRLPPDPTLGAARIKSLAPDEIYLDHHATTPIDARVLARMLPFFGESFGNPHSVVYGRAEAARAAVAEARSHVAALIKAKPEEIVFTSGATEATNIALRGLAPRKAGHLVVSAIEHACVRETAHALREAGWALTTVSVDGDGLVDPDEVANALRDDTAVVSVMMANNEIGTLQPIAEIGAACRMGEVPLHVDAAQAVGKVTVDVEQMAISAMSISSHKLYGPQGVGALFCRAALRDRLRPIQSGGGQEHGLRPGTLPLPLVVGFGEACRIAAEEMAAEAERLTRLRSRLLARLREKAPPFVLNGSLERRLPGNLNVSFAGVEGDAIVGAVRGVALSTGSACSSGAIEPSHVLLAMDLARDVVDGAVRIGLGRGTSEEDVDLAADRISAAANALIES